MLAAEPKPSANQVAELGSATFCLSPPQAGSGRTCGCLIGKHMKSCHKWALSAVGGILTALVKSHRPPNAICMIKTAFRAS